MSVINSIIPTHYIMSIKPKFVAQIKAGSKHWEFRKSWAVAMPCPTQIVHIYETSPTEKVVGEFTVGRVIRAKPEDIWLTVGDRGGISFDEFFGYFVDCEKAVAIQIVRPRWYPKNRQFGVWLYGMKRPPQSYALIKVPQENVGYEEGGKA